ncbi:MAG TPA: diphosphate--fructose-6-phosphate 1-phosphotransferase [Thermodesulfovibrio thiophilus]|uniref:diphosphate--fructose-6-phosphate 1-phosphotransferase n=1 Tax=Thermodesulfovibrio thiophilus TaxID=340095 RepID=UPI0017C7D40B|nr:diphosphate--fructose-6-phosphate 1-phosphotransferase [Thermodesulfovibrio thiophilus]HHW20213.1 6-phosphofructokinase [Thermodesulfovibrio thiophilus]HOA83018.1 diphosphate--fructose-6-phosphate 1-phosphotransferase [Thermodesulfovibrio thiophilus]HQA03482.1 diphosphate--fructose-6-phosphate 1-phosphotransferase [Thermodesulfovibrio thiophilus]HQD36093.1 diphosphate--fructose-6-phosphate 1-phosphotransferase [Thermodesulfovibrio thiophilus]
METVGIIVGGGPAPGINGTISAATIEAINQGKRVIGIKGGFKPLFDGDLKCAEPLTVDDVSRIHTKGGSILRTSREHAERVKERFSVLMQTLKNLDIKYLITIGGDGTLFMANWIEREARGDMNVVHVPKTIDNDIPLPGGASTFGYETARHWGVEIAKNIMEDARVAGRWYFLTIMGRYTGHLALGVGKAAGVTLTIIPEEFPEEKISFKKVADILTGAIIKRLSMGRDHGVAILAEGLAEKFDPDELLEYEQLEKDETGRVRLSEIQLGRIVKNFVKKSLEEMGINPTIVDKNIGYELRSADPIPYDIEYTRNLGYGAVRYLLRGGTGAMITFEEGHLRPIPFVELLDYKTGKVKIRKVDITSENYEVGRKYMIRLEKEDFDEGRSRALAEVVKMSEEQFRERFFYVTT